MGEWWETFFDQRYLQAGFSPIKRKRTLSDVRFILSALSLPKEARILDVCCGLDLYRWGRSTEKGLNLRLYSVHELVGLLERAGFTLKALYGDREKVIPTRQHRMSVAVAGK